MPNETMSSRRTGGVGRAPAVLCVCGQDAQAGCDILPGRPFPWSRSSSQPFSIPKSSSQLSCWMHHAMRLRCTQHGIREIRSGTTATQPPQNHHGRKPVLDLADFRRWRWLVAHAAPPASGRRGQDVRNALCECEIVKPRARNASGSPSAKSRSRASCGDDSGAHAGEIEKNTRFQLLRVQAVLHQITDTHDALQLVVLDHRQVTDPRYRHSRKHGIDAIGGATTEDRRRHQALDIKADYRGAVSGHRVDEVTSENIPTGFIHRSSTTKAPMRCSANLRTANSTLSAVCILTTLWPFVRKTSEMSMATSCSLAHCSASRLAPRLLASSPSTI